MTRLRDLRPPASWQDPVTLPRWQARLGGGIVIALAVALVTSTVVAIAVEPGAPADEPEAPAEPVTIRDDFDRSESGTLGTTPDGDAWQIERGEWGVDEAGARIERADGNLPSLAVVDFVPGDAFVRMEVGNAPAGMGMVVHYRDPANYFAIVAAPAFGTWTVRRLENGVLTELGGVGAVEAAAGTAVDAVLRDDSIDIYVDGTYAATFTATPSAEATAVGLIGETGTSEARWQAFEARQVAPGTVIEPGSAPSPTTSTSAPG